MLTGKAVPSGMNLYPKPKGQVLELQGLISSGAGWDLGSQWSRVPEC